MIHELFHEIFQVHGIHEILHLLSGCVGSFFGTWAYFYFIHKSSRSEWKDSTRQGG